MTSRARLIAVLLATAACTGSDAFVGGQPPPAGDAPVEPDAPANLEPVVVDLGQVTTGTDVTFEIPAGALGFNISAEGSASDYDPSAPFGIERIVDPDGNVVHDAFRPKGGTNETSIALFDTIASASVPQAESVGDKLEGTWKVRFGVLGAPSRQVRLGAKVRIQASGDGAFHGGKLDLHIHVPEGLRIGDKTVSDAKTDPAIAERIDTFFLLTTRLIGIDRGDVVITTESTNYRQLDGEQDLVDGFRVSKGEKEGAQRLHILLTNLIALDGEPIAAGIAPGIPGAPMQFGRGVSGIIVTTSRSSDHDALTMLHEAGHFVGLNHTTELDGNGGDPLSDTPLCGGLSAQNEDGFLSCPDRKNVMFVAGAIDGPVVVSPSQQRVYRGSPIYKAARTAKIGTAASALQTRSLAPFVFRASGRTALSPIERELSAGFCGLTKIDARRLVARYGHDAAVAQLRAAAADTDLEPFMRGRAATALKGLGEPARSAP